MAASPVNAEILHDFPFFRVYKDGRVEMLSPDCEKIPPTDDPITGVRSKDVIISSDPHVTARIFLPPSAKTQNRLPLLFYIHGGGFCMLSAFSPQYHDFCNKVAADANAVVVSVEYGLFPTRPIPACYEDSWTALQWVASHVAGDGPEPWLNHHADFQRVFIGGDSAGANISHTLAVRVGSIGLPAGVKVVGVIMVHPYFAGVDHIDRMCVFMGASNGGMEDPRIKPTMEDLRRLGCERVLVFVAEKDEYELREVGIDYCEKLKKSGWNGSVEIVEHVGQSHVFHLKEETKLHEDAVVLVQKFVSLIKQD